MPTQRERIEALEQMVPQFEQALAQLGAQHNAQQGSIDTLVSRVNSIETYNEGLTQADSSIRREMREKTYANEQRIVGLLAQLGLLNFSESEYGEPVEIEINLVELANALQTLLYGNEEEGIPSPIEQAKQTANEAKQTADGLEALLEDSTTNLEQLAQEVETLRSRNSDDVARATFQKLIDQVAKQARINRAMLSSRRFSELLEYDGKDVEAWEVLLEQEQAVLAEL